jgi:hypothetical protein
MGLRVKGDRLVLGIIKGVHLGAITVAIVLSTLSMIAKHGNVARTPAQEPTAFNNGVLSERVTSLADREKDVEGRVEELEKERIQDQKAFTELADGIAPIKDAVYWILRLMILVGFYVIAVGTREHFPAIRKFIGGKE